MGNGIAGNISQREKANKKKVGGGGGRWKNKGSTIKSAVEKQTEFWVFWGGKKLQKQDKNVKVFWSFADWTFSISNTKFKGNCEWFKIYGKMHVSQKK